MEKYQYFNGLKFTRDDETGYYLNSTIGKRIHRYVWEYNNGKIPKGYHIHHMDYDKSNNDISNLMLIEAKQHVAMHSVERGLINYEAIIENLDNNARPKANEWHGSDEGHEWHKEQYRKYLGKWTENRVAKTCEQCGSEFKTIDNGKGKFCSNKCKAKWRRESGIDDETRTCQQCENDFTINKYSKAKYCSRSCSKKAYWDNKRAEKASFE